MLEKLNQVANLVSEMIAGHPDKKKRKPAEADEEQDEESKVSRVQKSIRKSTGGEKEPAY